MNFDFGHYPYTHWKGPYGVLVNASIEQAVAHDNCNMIDRDGVTTTYKVPTCPMPSEEEWKAEHAYKNGDNWYYILPAKKTHSVPFSCGAVLETI